MNLKSSTLRNDKGLSGFRWLYVQLFIQPKLGHRKFEFPISDDSIGGGKGSFSLQRSL